MAFPNAQRSERRIVCLNSVQLLIKFSLMPLGCRFFFVHADVVHAAVVFVVVGIIGRRRNTVVSIRVGIVVHVAYAGVLRSFSRGVNVMAVLPPSRRRFPPKGIAVDFLRFFGDRPYLGSNNPSNVAL